MAQELSSYLGVAPEALKKLNVLDAIIGVDANFFIDPHLLKRSKIPEFKNSGKKLEQYFGELITIIQASVSMGDIAWRKARARLIFKEVRGASIGYGVHSSDGNAIGPKLGLRLLKTAQEIIAMGIKDPAIFELLGLFEDGFGADRLSDMTMRILLDDFYSFTERVAKSLGVKNVSKFTLRGREFILPIHPNGGKPLVLIPMSVLRDLPIALSYDDIGHVVGVNQELRERVNQLIGKTWTKKTKLKKRDIRSLVLRSPKNLEYLLQTYKSDTGTSYDFENDPEGELVWYSLGQKYAKQNLIKLPIKQPKDLREVEDTVRQIILQFQKNIEVNGLNEHLYANGKPRHERFSQRLFYSTGDTYCKANNVDLNREPNAGSGPVDFKTSRGYHARVLVEIKLSSHPRLIDGYVEQLPAYAKSESTEKTVYLVIRVTRSDAKIRALMKKRDELVAKGVHCPEIFVIDGLLKPSASKRRKAARV